MTQNIIRTPNQTIKNVTPNQIQNNFIYVNGISFGGHADRYGGESRNFPIYFYATEITEEYQKLEVEIANVYFVNGYVITGKDDENIKEVGILGLTSKAKQASKVSQKLFVEGWNCVDLLDRQGSGDYVVPTLRFDGYFKLHFGNGITTYDPAFENRIYTAVNSMNSAVDTYKDEVDRTNKTIIQVTEQMKNVVNENAYLKSKIQQMQMNTADLRTKIEALENKIITGQI